MKPLFTLLSLIIFMTPAWADLHKFDLHPNTLSYDVSVIVEEQSVPCDEQYGKCQEDAELGYM